MRCISADERSAGKRSSWRPCPRVWTLRRPQDVDLHVASGEAVGAARSQRRREDDRFRSDHGSSRTAAARSASTASSSSRMATTESHVAMRRWCLREDVCSSISPSRTTPMLGALHLRRDHERSHAFELGLELFPSLADLRTALGCGPQRRASSRWSNRPHAAMSQPGGACCSTNLRSDLLHSRSTGSLRIDRASNPGEVVSARRATSGAGTTGLRPGVRAGWWRGRDGGICRRGRRGGSRAHQCVPGLAIDEWGEIGGSARPPTATRLVLEVAATPVSAARPCRTGGRSRAVRGRAQRRRAGRRCRRGLSRGRFGRGRRRPRSPTASPSSSRRR